MKTHLLSAATAALAISLSALPLHAQAPAPTAAPSGVYKLDLSHAILQWSVNHQGRSHYHARFTRFDATLNLDAANPAASKISLTIDPTSVVTNYPFDYKATHPQSAYASWDEEVGKSFIGGARFPQITFVSTGVHTTGATAAKVTGDLTFLGVTKPVTLDVQLIGQTASANQTKAPAVGFHAKGAIKRSDFGVSAGTQDVVEIEFDGEFLQPAAK